MADGLKNMNLSQYRSWMQKRIEFLNHAQRGFPEERIRFHTCYGVNFGPRLSDLQLDQVMDLNWQLAENIGGGGRNRTGVHGFAGRKCIEAQQGVTERFSLKQRVAIFDDI